MPATAEQLIKSLGLQPHPEGGHYAETWRSPVSNGERASCTAIHFLLKAGERSHWHRVDADEIWCFHAGDPLELRISVDGTSVTTHKLEAIPSPSKSVSCQVVVPKGAWQAARALGDYALVSCVVAPGFSFDGFEMADPSWEPGQLDSDASTRLP